MKTKRIRSTSNFLVDTLTITLFVLMFVSQFKLLPEYNYMCLGCVMALFVLIMFDRRYRVQQKPVLGICLFYVLWTCILPLLLGQNQMFNRYVSLSEGFIFFLVYDYNLKVRGHRANLRMLIVLLVVLLYPTIFTLMALDEDGNACRGIKSSFQPGDVSFYYFLRGVLGYELIYSVVIISISLFGLLLYENHKIKSAYRVLISIYILLFTVLVVMSNYFTATVLLFLGYFGIILLRRGAKVLLFLVPFLFIYAVGRNTINEGVMNAVLTIVPEGKTHDRIELIKSSMGEEDELGDLDSREETNKRSEDLIFEYPILGYITDSQFSLNKVGQHSYLLDTMGLYGIPIGILGCYAMILPLLSLYRQEKKGILKRYWIVMGGIYMFLLFRNNMTLTVGCSAYFFFPIIFSQLKETIYEKNTHSRPLVQ